MFYFSNLTNFNMSILGLMSIGLLSGCQNQSDFQLVPVSGRVTFDGKPVDRVTVYFSPLMKGEDGNPGPNSFGVTDPDGNYKMMTVRGDTGAVVGQNNVSITGEVWEGD